MGVYFIENINLILPKKSSSEGGKKER